MRIKHNDSLNIKDIIGAPRYKKVICDGEGGWASYATSKISHLILILILILI